jgi:hypothetical protein
MRRGGGGRGVINLISRASLIELISDTRQSKSLIILNINHRQNPLASALECLVFIGFMLTWL